MTTQEQYEKDLEEWKNQTLTVCRNEMDNYWRIHGEEINKLDKWIMTIAAGSFGLSFVFIDTIVPVNTAAYLPVLFSAWACFLAVLAVGLIGSMASALLHLAIAAELNSAIPLIQEGKRPEYKKRGVFLSPNAVLGYAQIALFIGGCVCLILFVAKNLL